MSRKVAFLTTIFPMKIEFLYDFFDSLEQQTHKKFDVIVVNDGFENFNEITEEYKMLDIIELKYSDTPAKNREFGINWCIDNQYDIIVFGDSDDFFEENRVAKTLDLLNDFDIVVNDLTLVDENGKFLKEKYISHRINNNTVVKYDFIKDKNIFGLSNTAVKTKLFKGKFEVKEDIVAVDWFLYKKLLVEGANAIFTNEITTYYRQYDANTIGLSLEKDSYPLWWEK